MRYTHRKGKETIPRYYREKGLLTTALLTDFCSSKWDATLYLYGENILNVPPCCPKCGGSITFKKNPFAFLQDNGQDPSTEKNCFYYRCGTRNGGVRCNWQSTVFNGTIFETASTDIRTTLLGLHAWLAGANLAGIMCVTDWSKETTMKYTRIFRRMCTRDLNTYLLCEPTPTETSSDVTYQSVQIGGPGTIVQVDESAFGKRKYNRGHYVDTKWVFGGIEITPTASGEQRGGKFFAVVVPDRTGPTLCAILKKYVRRGTLIVSDGWKGYCQVKNLPGFTYSHEMVNHSENFKDPVTGLHTNTMEAKWGALKRKIPARNFATEDGLQEYLHMEMWLKLNEGQLWESRFRCTEKFR